MKSELICFNAACRASYPVTSPIYNCPACGGLLEAAYPGLKLDAAVLKQVS